MGLTGATSIAKVLPLSGEIRRQNVACRTERWLRAASERDPNGERWIMEKALWVGFAGLVCAGLMASGCAWNDQCCCGEKGCAPTPAVNPAGPATAPVSP